MNKFKNWLRIRLKQFLDIDDIESIFRDHEVFNNIRFNDIDSEISKTKYKIEATNHKLEIYSQNTNSRISHFQESANVLHNTIENVVHIGTDFRPYGGSREHSWAIVCIEGKINIVKFIDLERKNAREILDFLKLFEAGKHCIDTPTFPIFDDAMFKF